MLAIVTLTVTFGYSGGIFTARARAETTQVPTTTPTPDFSPTSKPQTALPTASAGPTPGASEAVGKPGRLITVNAIGQVQAAPDVANLSVGSEVQAPTAREALDKAKANGEKISKALIDAGIPEKDIQTSNINAYPYNTPGKDGNPVPEPTSYRASVNLSITIRDLSKSGIALDAATRAGANQVGGVQYIIKDDSDLRAQALEQAVKQARPKAEAIARGLGLQIGEVLTVEEDPNGYYGPQYGGGKGDSGINPGQLTVGVRVIVTYAIL
jgi:uncharacterized protein YggE